MPAMHRDDVIRELTDDLKRVCEHGRTARMRSPLDAPAPTRLNRRAFWGAVGVS